MMDIIWAVIIYVIHVNKIVQNVQIDLPAQPVMQDSIFIQLKYVLKFLIIVISLIHLGLNVFCVIMDFIYFKDFANNVKFKLEQ